MRIQYSRRAAKNLRNISGVLRKRVILGLKNIEDQPSVGKKLKGSLAHLRSLRVGECRIIYYFDKKRSLIVIESVRFRGSSYKLY